MNGALTEPVPTDPDLALWVDRLPVCAYEVLPTRGDSPTPIRVGLAAVPTAACYVDDVLRPRSLPAHPPILDREVLRAIAAPRGHRARSPEALADEVVAAAGRSTGRWVPDAAVALADALFDRLGDVPIAAPSFGRTDLGAALTSRFTKVFWMDPEAGWLDPGAEEVSAALERGARAVVLSPIVGQGGALIAVSEACQAAGALLAVDARRSPGCRVLDRVVSDFGQLVLLPVDGEPCPAAVWGAVLAGDAVPAAAPMASNGRLPGHALRLMLTSIRDEPRLRRLLPRPSAADPTAPDGPPPGWACAAASVRLSQASSRASQRALHARTLRTHCGNLHGVELVPDPPGCQSAAAAFPLLADRRDVLTEHLRARGIPVLGDDIGPLRPDGKLGWGAREPAAKLLLLPLLPFYRRQDLVFLAEQLRLAAYATTEQAL